MTGDILSVTVRADGWSADVVVEGFTTGATYDFGLGTNNANLAGAKVVFTVVSEGYSSAGTLGTVTRTVYGTTVVRKPYPDEAQKDETGGGNLTVRIALSDPIYDDDNTGAGKSGTAPTATFTAGWCVNSGGGSQSSNASSGVTVTNNSTLDYPKVVGRWGQPSFERWTGDTAVEFTAFHPFARDGKPAAVVLFDASDTSGNNAAQQSATAMEVSPQSDANKVSVYRATIPVSALTQGNVVTVRARAYPWVGDSDSTLDTSTAADGTAEPTPALAPLMALLDKTDSLALYASVSPSGSSGGVTSTSKATARATPFLTIRQAADALKTANGGATDNCVILIQNGNYAFPNATAFTGSATKSFLVIQADTDNGATEAGVVINSTGASTFNTYVKFQDVTFSGSMSAMRGGSTTGILWLDSCTLNLSSSSAFYNWAIIHATRCTVQAMAQGFVPFSSNKGPFVLVRGNDATSITAGTSATAYALLGNRGIAGVFMETGNAGSHVNSDGAFIGWNSRLNTSSLWASQWFNATTVTKGVAIVGNLAERVTDNTQPFVQLAGDNVNTIAVANIYIAHNTFAGQRCNLNYLEGGTVNAARNNWFDLYNLFRDFNTKTDTFDNATYDPSGNRVGNWAWVNGVGCRGSRYELANFPRDFAGIDVAVVGSGSMGYTDDESVAGGGAGNGDYSLTSGSVARNRIPSGQAVLPFDLNGVRFGNAGDGSAGALQRSGDLITFNPGLQTGFGFFA